MWTNLTFSADMSTFPQLKGSFYYNAFFGKRFNNFGIFSLEFCSYHPWISVIIAHLHYMKNIRIRSYSGPHFFRIFPHLDWIWRDTPHLSVFSPNAGKMRTRITPNTDTFYAVQIVGLIGGDYLRAHRLCIVDDLWLWTMTMIYFAFNLIIC